MIPTTAVILLKIEVHELNQKGELSGKPLLQSELKEADLDNSLLVTIKGTSKEDCLNRVKEWIKKSN